MAALVAVARLVARVRLEQALVQVRERGAVDVLDQLAAQVGQRYVADARAEPLDDRDDRERARDRVDHALLEQQLGLRVVRVVRRHVAHRQRDQRVPLVEPGDLEARERRHRVRICAGVNSS